MMELTLNDRTVYFDHDTLEWVVEFTTGEVARSKSRQAIQDVLDYADTMAHERT